MLTCGVFVSGVSSLSFLSRFLLQLVEVEVDLLESCDRPGSEQPVSGCYTGRQTCADSQI